MVDEVTIAIIASCAGSLITFIANFIVNKKATTKQKNIVKTIQDTIEGIKEGLKPKSAVPTPQPTPQERAVTIEPIEDAFPQVTSFDNVVEVDLEDYQKIVPYFNKRTGQTEYFYEELLTARSQPSVPRLDV